MFPIPIVMGVKLWPADQIWTAVQFYFYLSAGIIEHMYHRNALLDRDTMFITTYYYYFIGLSYRIKMCLFHIQIEGKLNWLHVKFYRYIFRKIFCNNFNVGQQLGPNLKFWPHCVFEIETPTLRTLLWRVFSKWTSSCASDGSVRTDKL